MKRDTNQIKRQAVTGTSVLLLKSARPRQWVKNALVFTVPIVGNVPIETHDIPSLIGALAAFSLVSAAIYLLNDVVDVALDKLHPEKRKRPIASGELSPQIAVFAGLVIAVLGLSLAFYLSGLGVLLVVATYLVVQVGYVLWAKNTAWLELAAIPVGFLLRVESGGAAVGVAVGGWTRVTIAAAALLAVSGKRLSELMQPYGASAETRPVLRGYSVSVFKAVVASFAGIVFIAGIAWGTGFASGFEPLVLFASICFIGAVARYTNLALQGQAESPEMVVTGDRTLMLFLLFGLLGLIARVTII